LQLCDFASSSFGQNYREVIEELEKTLDNKDIYIEQKETSIQKKKDTLHIFEASNDTGIAKSGISGASPTKIPGPLKLASPSLRTAWTTGLKYMPTAKMQITGPILILLLFPRGW